MALVPLVAGALLGRQVQLPPIPTETLLAEADCGEEALAAHLGAFGCRVWRDAERGWLTADGPATRGAEIDLSTAPGLVLLLAPLAAQACRIAGAPSRFTGLGSSGCEDRLESLAAALAGLGLGVERGPEHLAVEPGRGDPVTSLDPQGDARLALSLALLGLVWPGLRVRGATCVDRWWPGFWEEMRGLGCRVLPGA